MATDLENHFSTLQHELDVAEKEEQRLYEEGRASPEARRNAKRKVLWFAKECIQIQIGILEKQIENAEEELAQGKARLRDSPQSPELREMDIYHTRQLEDLKHKQEALASLLKELNKEEIKLNEEETREKEISEELNRQLIRDAGPPEAMFEMPKSWWQRIQDILGL